MAEWNFKPQRRHLPHRGFALVATLLCISLLVVIGIGMLGLATIEIRRSGHEGSTAIARANARLALIEALGRLQADLGPDQRVSATAAVLGDQSLAPPHWTGAWTTTAEDGGPWLTREDLNGGLRDRRFQPGGDGRNSGFLGWLVSGNGNRSPDSAAPSVDLLTSGETNGFDPVRAPIVPILDSSGNLAAHQAWWVGDLGVRANLATADRHGDQPASLDPLAEAGLFRALLSQQANTTSLIVGKNVDRASRSKFASDRTLALATPAAIGLSRSVDVTIASRGVLADPARGGLKQDLTRFLTGSTAIPPLASHPGLAAEDPIIGAGFPETAVETRYSRSSPRFGRLRDWARGDHGFTQASTDARTGTITATNSEKSVSTAHALANATAVDLQKQTTARLQPILVEASLFNQISTLQVPGSDRPRFQLRTHLYPRVVLWNPYNTRLTTRPSIVMIQGNGRQEMWTDNQEFTASGIPVFRSTYQWLNFEGGRSTSFNVGGILTTEGYNDPYIGSYYFALPETTFGPGECLVFSAAESAEYDGLSAYKPGQYDLASNLLSCETAPDVARSYYVTGTEINGGTNGLPQKFWYAPTTAWSAAGRNGIENQGDDSRVIWKELPKASGSERITYEAFDALPQLGIYSDSFQYGAGREPRIAWNRQEKMPMELLDFRRPRPTIVPNVRTRVGLRLRWFEEHESNRINSGILTGTPYLEEALLANWNPRASFALRSPRENIGGTLPQSGPTGGPYFFGVYTRDLFDSAVSWQEQVPVRRDGRYHGNPFGQPQEGAFDRVIFDVPRQGVGIYSLAQFQNAQLSELIWHPSLAIGNSLADPRIGGKYFADLDHTSPLGDNDSITATNGFHSNQIGWSSDQERSQGRDEWANTAKAILQDLPKSDDLVYDLSFEGNTALWDRFFLSNGDLDDFEALLDPTNPQPLPNGRLVLSKSGMRGSLQASDLDDFHTAARHLMVDGAFNVNSTSVPAWTAILASTRDAATSGTAFPRMLDAPGGAWTSAEGENSALWDGYRVLDDEEIDRLAHAIVRQVKLRGPFISLGDFVNRRLAADETGRMGALQAAIEDAGLNQLFQELFPLNNQESLPDYRHPDNVEDATAFEQTLKPDSKAWGIPGYLIQGDLLQVIGPALAARSDTFQIRAYGDAVDSQGKVIARAWCEAVVQRTPVPVAPDETGWEPRIAENTIDFGRTFEIVSFRWLQSPEI